jgi:hypothetical protein
MTVHDEETAEGGRPRAIAENGAHLTGPGREDWFLN